MLDTPKLERKKKQEGRKEERKGRKEGRNEKRSIRIQSVVKGRRKDKGSR